MQARFNEPDDPRNAGGPEGIAGKYKTIFTLSRPGQAISPENHFMPASNLKGDSHLAIAEPALSFLQGESSDQLYFQCATPEGIFAFIGFSNEKGFLSRVESEPFDANSFSDAAWKAHHAIASTLSSMSVYFDVPVNIYQMDVIEVRTGSLRLSILMPFRAVPGVIMPPIREWSAQQQKYASLYREALGSSSSNYQFLCLYRIIEGLRERRQRVRGEAAKDARRRGKVPTSRPETKIPSDLVSQRRLLNSVFPNPRKWSDGAVQTVFITDVLDRKISNLIHKAGELHRLRNQIAHAVLDSAEDVISIDNGLDLDKVEAWLPITKFLARYLLKEAFPDMFAT
jgi:hypothetical protein